MKKLLPILFLSLTSLSLNAQTELDSLYSVWEDEAQSDSVRIDAYKDYIWKGFLFSKPDSAFVLAEKLMEFGQAGQYLMAQASGYKIQGTSCYIKSNYPKALGYFQRSLEIYEEVGDKKRIASLLNNIGLTYSNQNDYLKAMNYLERSLKIKDEIGDNRGMASALINVGLIHHSQGNFPKALDYYHRSLKLIEEIGDSRTMANLLNNIGVVYNDQGNDPEALDYYQRSLIIYEEIGDKRGITASLGNIGVAYKKQGNYTNATDYYQRGLEISTEIGDIAGIATSLNNIGKINIAQGKYQAAIIQCQKSLDLSKEYGAIERQKTACSCLYEAHKAMGNGNEALVYLEKIQVLDDSLHAEETAKKLQQMEFDKQILQDSIAKAEADRLVLEAHQEEMRQEEKNRTWLLGGGVLALVLAGGFFSRWRYVRRSKAIIEEEKDRSENLLLNILPEEIAQELKIHGKAEARDFDLVSILFSDFKDFTSASAKMSAAALVNEINFCFEAFDGIMGKHGIEKIKTIGDSYMAAGGLPVPTDVSTKNTVLAALEMQSFISSRKAENDAKGKHAFEMRVGIHTGPVVAGIVGVKKFQYDIWGDTVNTASRMESAGEVGKVNVSQATYELLKDEPQFSFESRGKIAAKGKGEVEMWFVSKA